MVVIAICGSPGTGKSTFADMLSSYGFHVIHLSKFVIENKLYCGYDRQRSAYIIDEDRLRKKLGGIISTKKSVIIEGIGAEALPSDWVDLCIVLVCEPYVLRERLERRGFSQDKIDENLEAERFGVILGEAISNYGKSKLVVIDTSNGDFEKIVGVIIDEIRRRGLLR